MTKKKEPSDLPEQASSRSYLEVDARDLDPEMCTLETLNWDGSEEESNDLEPGTSVGRYVLLELIGTGGMGRVYKAYDPHLDRNVALKILHKSRSDDKSAKSQNLLLHEAHALAKLSHPNVVAIHDVGVFDDQVFLAMEMVTGQSMRYWLLEQETSIAEKMKVLLQAGKGLAAAHQANLIHFDFKPENIIIGEDGRVRVTDFGLAHIQKRTIDSDEWTATPDPAGQLSSDTVPSGPMSETDSGRLQDSTQVDSTMGSLSSRRPGHSMFDSPFEKNRIVGTPPYMSPEQIRRQEVDPRSDQFSFCVVAHEALYGVRPFQGKRFRDLKRAITNGLVVPPPKEANVPYWIRRIMLRGLAVDPDERYENLDALLDNLADDPTARRNRLLSYGAILLVFVLSILGTWRLFGQQSTLCQGAQQHMQGVWDTNTKEAIKLRFGNSGLSFAQSVWNGVEGTIDTYAQDWTSMHTESCEATRIRGEFSESLLDARMFCLSQRLWEVKELVDILHQADAKTIENAFNVATNLTAISSCAYVDVRSSGRQLPKNAHTRKRIKEIRSKISRAKILGQSGDHREGMRLAEQAVLEAKQVAYQPITAEALFIVSRLQEVDRNYAQAEKSLKQALVAAHKGNHSELEDRIYNRLIFVTGYLCSKPEIATYLSDVVLARFSSQHQNEDHLAEWHNNLGIVYQSSGNNEKARHHLQQAMDKWSHLFGLEHPKVAACVNNLAIAYRKQGEYQKAIDLHRKSLDSMRKNLGPDYPSLSEPLTGLGIVYRLQREFDKALEYQLQALAIREAVLGKNHPDIAYLLNNLSVLYNDRKEHERALAIQQRVLRIRTTSLEKNHPDLAQSHTNLGIIYNSKADFANALKHFRESLTILEQIHGSQHPSTVQAIKHVALVLDLSGQSVKAIQNYQRALRILKRHYGDESIQVAEFLVDLGQVYQKTNSSSKSIAAFDSALSILEKTKGSEHPQVAKILNRIARVYEESRRYDKAIAYRRRALKLIERSDSVELAETLQHVIVDYYKSRKTITPGVFFKELLDSAEASQVAQTLGEVAGRMAKKQDYQKAIPLQSEALAIHRKELGKKHTTTVATHATLCQLYKLGKKHHQSRDCYQSLLNLVGNDSQVQNQLGDILYNYALLSQLLGDDEKGIASYRRVLSLWTRAYGPNSIKVANALFNLGSLFYNKQDYVNASENFERVLSISDKTKKLDADLASRTHRYLGDIARKQNKAAMADSHYKASLAVVATDQPAQQPEAHDSLKNLGEIAHQAGKLEEASGYFQQALERVVEPSKKAYLQYQMGEIRKSQKRLDQARGYYQKALQNWSKSKEGNERILAIVSINLGDLAFENRDWKTSRSHYQVVLSTLDKLPDPNVSHQIHCLYNLGMAYQKSDNAHKAYQFLERALALRAKHSGDDNKNLATNCLNLGVVAEKLKKPKRAVFYYQKSLAYLTQSQTPNNDERIQVQEKIASLYLSIGEPAKAVALLENALANNQNGQRQYNGQSIRSLTLLMRAYRYQGRVDKELKLFAQSQSFLRDAIKNHDNNLVGLFVELGHTHNLQENYDKALKNYQKALAVREQEFGKSSLAVCSLLQKIAAIYEKKKDFESMTQRYQRILQIRAQHLDPYHPGLAESYKALGYAFYLSRSLANAKNHFEKSVAIYKRCSPQVVPGLEFVVAKLMWSIGKDKDQAIDLAKKSYRALQQMKHSPGVQKQIRKWLQRNAKN